MIIKLLILLFFITASVLHLFFELKENLIGRYLTKPLLMPLLLLLYLINASSINYLIIGALICGFLGDVFLMQPTKNTFVLIGLISFLTGHVFYIITFLIDTVFLSDISLYFFFLAVPYFLIEILLIKKLFPSMKSMKIPVTLYMSVIIIMSFTSLTRIFSVSLISFLLVYIGSLFFITSDTVLAFDMFKKHRQFNEIAIMVTYILAQAFIVFGLLI